MNWDDIKLFLAVADHGSLAGAAQELRVDPATLSRRMQRFERDIGQVVFRKSLKGYALTPIGEAYLKRARDVERAMRHLNAALPEDSDKLSGTIRLGAPDGSANFLLPRICAKIMAGNPDLHIDIVALPRIFNLTKGEADMAISVTAPQASHLKIDKIADYHLHLAAHKDYLSQHAPIRSIDDLKQHPIIGYIRDLIFTRELDYLSELSPDITTSLGSNSVSVQMNLAQESAGICIAHDFAMHRFPELRLILHDQFQLDRSFYLLRHKSEAKDARQSRFADLLVSHMKAELRRLEQNAQGVIHS